MIEQVYWSYSLWRYRHLSHHFYFSRAILPFHNEGNMTGTIKTYSAEGEMLLHCNLQGGIIIINWLHMSDASGSVAWALGEKSRDVNLQFVHIQCIRCRNANSCPVVTFLSVWAAHQSASTYSSPTRKVTLCNNIKWRVGLLNFRIVANF